MEPAYWPYPALIDDAAIFPPGGTAARVLELADLQQSIDGTVVFVELGRATESPQYDNAAHFKCTAGSTTPSGPSAPAASRNPSPISRRWACSDSAVWTRHWRRHE